MRKISIIPRGQALGVTLSTPEADRYGYERDDLIGKIKVALGGRAAERVVYDEMTTGAESDIQQLTQIARGMVGRWGMSDVIGPIAVADGRSDGMLLPGPVADLPETQRLVDEEVRRIVEEAEHDTIALIERERPRLEALARALLSQETLDQAEAYEIAGVPLPESADERPPGVASPSSGCSAPRRGAARRRSTRTTHRDRRQRSRRASSVASMPIAFETGPVSAKLIRREADRDEPVEAVDAAAQLRRHARRHERPPDDHAGGHARALEERDDDELPERACRTRRRGTAASRRSTART